MESEKGLGVHAVEPVDHSCRVSIMGQTNDVFLFSSCLGQCQMFKVGSKNPFRNGPGFLRALDWNLSVETSIAVGGVRDNDCLRCHNCEKREEVLHKV